MSNRNHLVSVIIPTFNRVDQLSQAIRSVHAQLYDPLEILIVDDASTEEIRETVRSFDDRRIHYIRHATRRNAAVARNTGILRARGKYVALLDSDDEWLPHHVSRKVELLEALKAHGAFGSFYLAGREAVTEFECLEPPATMTMAEYILSSHPGDTRTSTFVFEREAIRQVMFDGSLEKHQDWDLAIRFDDRFGLLCDRESTVIIHPHAYGRMSHGMKHAATREFLGRYGGSLTARTRARIYTNFARWTLQREGRNRYFSEYVQQAFRHWVAAAPRDKMLILGLLLPGLDRLVLRLGGWYAKLRSRRSKGPRLP